MTYWRGCIILMHMKYNNALKSLAKIRSGFAFRSAIDPSSSGGWRVIQPKNIASGDFSDIVQVKADSVPASHLLTDGDVLVTNRGTVRAYVFRGHAPTITTNTVFAISVFDRGALLPEYLALYINSEYGQRQIKTKQSGMTVMAMTASEIADLLIPIPPKDQQQVLVKLNEAVTRSADMMSELNKLQKTILNESIKGVLNG